MPPVGFEPTISANERPQTHALDRAATGTGKPLARWNNYQGNLDKKLCSCKQITKHLGTVKRLLPPQNFSDSYNKQMRSAVTSFVTQYISHMTDFKKINFTFEILIISIDTFGFRLNRTKVTDTLHSTRSPFVTLLSRRAQSGR